MDDGENKETEYKLQSEHKYKVITSYMPESFEVRLVIQNAFSSVLTLYYIFVCSKTQSVFASLLLTSLKI
jgi:hypothetical protein